MLNKIFPPSVCGGSSYYTPPPYYYFKGFLQNRRFAKIGWIKLGDLTGLYAGSRKKVGQKGLLDLDVPTVTGKTLGAVMK